MPLPQSERVVFERNPLFAVSAQIRFPPILRIQVETPSLFQESIRADFPGYEIANPQVAMPTQVPPELQAAIQATLQTNLNVNFEKAHRFITSDQNWVVQISKDSLTMSCKNYPRWEVFRDKLESVFNPFHALYKLPFASMLGLRYQNAIERSKLELESVEWRELLKPFIAAEFACDGLSETDILSDLHRFEFTEGMDKIYVQHGMATNQSTKEQVYSIDSNFLTKDTDKVDISNVFKRLDQLNKHSGKLFRLCITERLYDSLKPIAI